MADYPAESAPLESLCQMLFESGPLDAAENALEELTKRQPDNGSAWHNLGTIYMRQMRYDQAAMAYRQSLQVRPGAAQTYLHLGMAYEKMGQLEQALAAWQETVRLAPQSQLAVEALDRIRRLPVIGE